MWTGWVREGKLSINNYNAIVYVLSDRDASVVTSPRGFELEGRGFKGASGKTKEDGTSRLGFQE